MALKRTDSPQNPIDGRQNGRDIDRGRGPVDELDDGRRIEAEPRDGLPSLLESGRGPIDSYKWPKNAPFREKIDRWTQKWMFWGIRPIDEFDDGWRIEAEPRDGLPGLLRHVQLHAHLLVQAVTTERFFLDEGDQPPPSECRVWGRECREQVEGCGVWGVGCRV